MSSAAARILAPVRRPLAVASVLVALAGICAIVPYVLIVEAARVLLAGAPDWTHVWTLLGIALAVLALRGVLQSTALLWSHLVDARHQAFLRQMLVDKLGRVPLGWFGERSTGQIKRHLQDDVTALHYLVAHARLDLVGAVVAPVVSLVYLFLVDWRLALILLAPLVVYMVALRFLLAGQNGDAFQDFLASERRVAERAIEFVDGIHVVRAFGQARRAHDRYQEAVDAFAGRFRDWAGPLIRIESLAGLLLNPVFLLCVIVVSALGFVTLGLADPLVLLPFILVGTGIGSFVLALGYGAQALRQASAAATRLAELQDEAELDVVPARPDETPDAAGRVRLEGVRFAYGDGPEVLHDIDLDLAPGTITALVGASGSGKSTLAALVARFHDVTAGRILLGGRDIRSLPPAELYRHVGFVLQDVRLIDGTIADNLRLARPGASVGELEAAARAAQLHETIAALPRGYASVVGEDARLSGGEAQRLSLARALLADAPILVLDEATAFADPESEAAIQDALAVAVAERTVLVIAHRLHTITAVDAIVVLAEGRIVERGTHDDLLAKDGAYRELWEAHSAAVRDVSEVTR